MKKTLLLLLILGVLGGAFSVTLPVLATEASSSETGHAGGGHEQSWWDIAGQWFNFVALVAILYLFLARSIKVQEKFKHDADEIRSSIESAREAKEEAERHLKELDERMAGMNEDIARIKAQAVHEAEEEKKRILESAQGEAKRIVEVAHREIDSEVRLARKQLRKHVADLAVGQGARIIAEEITEDDQHRLINDYIEGFGK